MESPESSFAQPFVNPATASPMSELPPEGNVASGIRRTGSLNAREIETAHNSCAGFSRRFT